MTVPTRLAIALTVGLTAGGMAAAESHGGGAGASEVAGDAAAGEAVFRRCVACHAVGEGAINKVGPHLNGVVGRPVASVEDFDYSSALQEMAEGGKVWAPEEIAAFIEAPRDYAPSTKMAYPGLKDEADRQNVIAYLASFDAE